MNEKLIRRAASKYHQWMITESQRPDIIPLKAITHHLHDISKKFLQIKIWNEHFFRSRFHRIQVNKWEPEVEHVGLLSPNVYKDIATNIIPNLGTDIINDIKMITSTLEKQNTITLISLRDIIEEITIINKTWSEVKFRNNGLSVLITNVILSDENEDVNLGDFWINLDFTENDDDELSIELTKEVTQVNGFCHPHVSINNKLCTGDGNILMRYALYQGRLEDYFRIVETILRTYNPDSIYENLAKWYDPQHENEFFCELCGEWEHDEYLCVCTICQLQCCEGCNNFCKTCEECICQDCLKTCNNCDEIYCSPCLTTCISCRNNFCLDCIDQECSKCKGKICKECQKKCNICDKIICEECQKNCNVCGKIICKECQITCKYCEVTICVTCKETHECL